MRTQPSEGWGEMGHGGHGRNSVCKPLKVGEAGGCEEGPPGAEGGGRSGLLRQEVA